MIRYRRVWKIKAYQGIPHVYAFGFKSVAGVLELSSKRAIYLMYMVSSSSSLRPKSQSLQKTLSSSQELGNSMLDFAHLAKTVEGKLGMEAEYLRAFVSIKTGAEGAVYLNPNFTYSSLWVSIKWLLAIRAKAFVYWCRWAHNWTIDTRTNNTAVSQACGRPLFPILAGSLLHQPQPSRILMCLPCPLATGTVVVWGWAELSWTELNWSER